MLALLRQSQIAANGHVLTVLRAILTWWTAHFHAYDRLLLIQEHLYIIIYPSGAQAPIPGSKRSTRSISGTFDWPKNEGGAQISE